MSLGVVVRGRFYRHTDHFLQVREERHPEATDERIRHVLDEPEYIEAQEGDRYACWRRIQESETGGWSMKVVVVENPDGPAILTAYRPTELGVEWEISDL
jgi:hypothetical protein